MEVPQTHKILTGTIVVFVRKKHYVYNAFPISTQLRERLEHEMNPARGFAALAEIAAAMYTPSVFSATALEAGWKELFGDFKINNTVTIGNDVSGTIIINCTEGRDFCFQLEKNECFIPYLLRAFMRREDPAAALAFLAEFSLAMSDTIKFERA